MYGPGSYAAIDETFRIRSPPRPITCPDVTDLIVFFHVLMTRSLTKSMNDFRPDAPKELMEVFLHELTAYMEYHRQKMIESIRRTVRKNGKSIRKSYEVDFYAVKGNRAYYIQVTENMSNEMTKAREIRPYKLLNDQVQKIIVVNKPVNETRDDEGFTIIGITDFLLRFI